MKLLINLTFLANFVHAHTYRILHINVVNRGVRAQARLGCNLLVAWGKYLSSFEKISFVWVLALPVVRQNTNTLVSGTIHDPVYKMKSNNRVVHVF